jgi:O-antigen ligase
MSYHLSDDNGQKKEWTAAVILLAVYLWWLVTTPIYSNKFAFLATIRFERLLAIAMLFAIVAGGNIKPRKSTMTPLVLLFFLFASVSYLISPYSGYSVAEYWFANYWKLIVFYFFVLYSIRDIDDLRRIFLAYAFISFAYQLYSWIGFLGGGSYVWQQGIKRIVGAWSGGGAGAPNAFGFLGVFSVPFAVFLLKTEIRRAARWMAVVLLGMSVASILFSGTRGAFLTLLVLVALYFRQRLMHPKLLIAFAIVAGMLLMVLPDDMKHRYGAQLGLFDTTVETRWDESASESAEGRVQGIVDGWRLFLKRPILGYGPETSSVARLEVRDLRTDRGELAYVQLHNLYAQLLSETGLIGGLTFAALVTGYFRQLGRIRRDSPGDETGSMIRTQAQLLGYLLLVILVYGMVSHTLYRYYWFFLFGCLANLAYLACPPRKRFSGSQSFSQTHVLKSGPRHRNGPAGPNGSSS